MGCDIHLYVEYRRDEDSEWENVDICPNCDVNALIPLYNDRDYEVFGYLANVRTPLRVVPISEPKGLPCDCSEIVKNEHSWWMRDVHSVSFFSLRELLTWQFKEVKRWDYTPLDDLIDRLALRLRAVSCKNTHTPNYMNILNEAENIRNVFWFNN